MKDAVTFGHGCIGSALARSQVQIALSVVPHLLPTLHLNGPVFAVPNYVIRATPHLPVSR